MIESFILELIVWNLIHFTANVIISDLIEVDAIRPHFIVPRAVKAWIIANFANFDMTTFSIEISQIFFFKFCSRIFSNISIGIVTQIGGSFDHFPYFFDSIEYRFRFTLVSYEIKRMSHVGTNFCHLELLLAHCEELMLQGRDVSGINWPDFQLPILSFTFCFRISPFSLLVAL